MTEEVVVGSVRYLERDGYLSDVSYAWGGAAMIGQITGKGLRAVGLWPTPDSIVDRLLASIDEEIAAAPDGDSRGRLTRARQALGDISREVLIRVAAGWASGELPHPH